MKLKAAALYRTRPIRVNLSEAELSAITKTAEQRQRSISEIIREELDFDELVDNYQLYLENKYGKRETAYIEDREAEANRCKSISFMLTQEQYKALAHYAKEGNATLSQAVRSRVGFEELVDKLKQEKERVPHETT